VPGGRHGARSTGGLSDEVRGRAVRCQEPQGAQILRIAAKARREYRHWEGVEIGYTERYAVLDIVNCKLKNETQVNYPARGDQIERGARVCMKVGLATDKDLEVETEALAGAVEASD
jgi:hypothetical protein